MEKEELENWWLQLETVDPYFMTPEPLPGDLYQVEEPDEYELFTKLDKEGFHYYIHTHCDDDSILVKPDKTRLFHKGYEE